MVTLYINGYETPVIVDDWFPSKWGRPAFSKTKNGEIWPMLLEKAWAKVHGSYMRTEGGQTAHATQHLLGIPAFTINHDEKETESLKRNFFRAMKRYDERNFVILASSRSGTNDQYSDGIVLGHAYSVISVVEFQAYGRNIQLMKMRNPWGKQGEWTGDWSDESDLWTDEFREICGSTVGDDGIFFIPLENYLTHFSETSVGCREENAHVSVANYQQDRTAYFKFRLNEDHHQFAVTVCQQGDRLGRYRPQSREDRYVPSPFSMLMIDLDSGNIIENSRAKTRQNFFHSLLINNPVMDQGNYLLVVDVAWDGSVNLDPGFDDILVRTYSLEPIILHKIEESEGRQYLRQALKTEGKHTKNKQYRNYYRESDAEYGQQVYRVSDPNTSVGFYSFVYRANQSRFGSTEKFNLTLTGLDFVGYVEEDFETIESGSDNIIVMRCQEAFGSTGFGMSYAMQARAMSDAEIVEKCKQEAVNQLTNDVTYQMMLTTIGGCILFHVHDTDKGRKITVDIEGSENLRIE